MDFDEVLAHFPHVRRSGAGWQARCPAHEDRTPSLTISEGDDGRTLVHCHAGCTTEDIVAAVGLTLRDLFVGTGLRSTTSRVITAIYPYTDEQGAVLYEVLRYAPKKFHQRRPDGHGAWIWKLTDVRRVLFGLPALQGQRIVYIAEGEKDVLALRALGLVATTNAGGAGQWRDDYSPQLHAAGVESVVILPDNDTPGQAHAVAVARSCHAVGLQVEVVTLPDLPAKSDVSDYLQTHTMTDLRALVSTTAAFDPEMVTTQSISTAADGVTLMAPGTASTQRRRGHPVPVQQVRQVRLTPASAIAVRPVRWLWSDRLPLGAVALLGGREGVGKSILMCQLAADVTRGRVPGVFAQCPQSVMIAATEDSWAHTIVPRLMAAEADLSRVFRVEVTLTDLEETALSLPQDLAALEQAIVGHAVALVIFDPLLSRLDASLDTHKDSEVRQALEPLAALADRTGASVVGLIHVNKSAHTDPLTTLMGSRAFAAVARAVLFVVTDPEDEEMRLLGQAKNNLGRADLPTLRFCMESVKVTDTPEGDVRTGKLKWMGETTRSIREVLDVASGSTKDCTAAQEAGDWLLDYLTEQGGTAESAAAKEAGKAAGHSIDALKRARRLYKVTVESRGFPRRTYWVRPPVGAADGRLAPTAPTALTAPTGETSQTDIHTTTSVVAVSAVGAVGGTLLRTAPTGGSLMARDEADTWEEDGFVDPFDA